MSPHGPINVRVGYGNKEMQFPLAQYTSNMEHLSSTTDHCWTTSTDRLLCCDNCIYVPDSSNLHLQVLQYWHDHPLSRHFSQTKTLYQVQRHYMRPGLPEFVK